MVSKFEFKRAATQAIQNIVKHGDTDIFPFPFENHAFFDKQVEIIDLVVEYDDNFEEYLTRFSPLNVSSLTPVTYSGFRWATQIDPIWNAHFLACVLALSKKMEEARSPKSDKVVFSYRNQVDPRTGDLFDRNFGWFQFMEHSLKLSSEFEFVVACDISEFYPRLGHHRLENALKQIAGDTPYPKRIMQFLSNYSNTRSFGLPIGGPAARILSEITINQIDRLLIGNGIKFARFADDYHLFAGSREDAYRHLIFLSEKLFDNQGLSLQKSKTRIMTSGEFRATDLPLNFHPAAVRVSGFCTPSGAGGA
ncbi:RNA-directed DNA polymerase, partial [Bradyrhizobium sp. 31Argb]|uniref:RNA-directed DNA polymerase n=1 Tax=Bradyrhizobium sp. 31Argb TaxID=3141247 RepID=UPI0037491D10